MYFVAPIRPAAVSCIKRLASCIYSLVNQWKTTLRNDVGFPTVYRRIYCRKFMTLSNQTSRCICKCIRISGLMLWASSPLSKPTSKYKNISESILDKRKYYTFTSTSRLGVNLIRGYRLDPWLLMPVRWDIYPCPCLHWKSEVCMVKTICKVLSQPL